MRRYATFFVIALMSLGLVFLLVTRARSAHEAPAEVVEVVADAGDAGALEAGTSPGPLAQNDAAANVDASPPKPVERPLRITALGWELMAGGVALTGDAGSPFAGSVELAPETSLEAVEARLARGGNDPVGADVAIVPLPAFVVAYERLRALDPRVFAVVGFSHGREEIRAAHGALSKPVPGADEVKLVAFGAEAADATARAAGSESATLLGLFAVDLLGIAPSRIRIVAPGSADAKGALFAALVRGASDPRKIAFTTADASRFVPIVAVAPRSQLDANEPKMRDLTRAWFEAQARAAKDPTNVARRLANKEALPLAAGVGGAPEAIALLERLGQVEGSSLEVQRALIDPSPRPLTLALLAQRTWALARAAGLTTIAAPDPLPIDARIVDAIAPPAPDAPARTGDPGGAGAPPGTVFGPIPSGATPLIVHRAVDPASDAASVSAQIGFLAAVFERCAFRITAKGGEKAARAIAQATHERFDVATTKLATTSAEPTFAFATVEILALP